MSNEPVSVGIVGLGRWARVLARASKNSKALKIVAGYSRSREKRDAFEQETGIRGAGSLEALLADPVIQGIIITVPNEGHLPIAAEAAKGGKHVYTEKPIANTLESAIKMEALQAQFGVKVMVGHSARLLKGTRLIRQAIDAGELGRVAFMEANFSNERALELTPETWRWYRAKAPGGPLSQLAIHQFDALHYLGGEIAEVSSIASKLSPVGAEVDDQSMTLLKFADGKIGYVGASWTAPGIYAIRVFGQKGLMHYELDFGSWDTPSKTHETSKLYIQRGKDGYGKREEIELASSDMFLDELEMFANVCRTGEIVELTARDGIVALATVYAGLRSIEQNGASVKIADVIEEARAKAASERQAA